MRRHIEHFGGVFMNEQEMRNEIALQTARIQRVDTEREFEIIKIFQMKWHGRVLFELLEESPRRFGELQREVPGISNAVLSSVLRSLVDRGLVDRVQYNRIPPHVEYSLTERGKALLPIYYEMIRWESEHVPESFR